jgi:hypothetical protein
MASVRTSEDKIFLIVSERRSTHTKNVKAIELVRENDVLLLSIPHSTPHQL